MRLPALLLAEQAEEQEDVPLAHALIGQMSLGRAALAKQAGSIFAEHRIMMAQGVCPQSPATGCTCQIAQPQIAIAGARETSAGDRKADRYTPDNRRSAATRRAIEPLAAEDDLHRASGAGKLRAQPDAVAGRVLSIATTTSVPPAPSIAGSPTGW
ncbi:MAG: hypothetical protein B7X57_10450 [Erythrobacter sp. 34-65-8]|nr:MAG: hypothetical protein B7X57_10450 [Erythrobacter sp. 34-65-8]